MVQTSKPRPFRARRPEKTTRITTVRLTEDEFQTLKKAGGSVAGVLRQAAEEIVLRAREETVRETHPGLEEEVQRTSLAITKIGTRIGELYAQARAQELKADGQFDRIEAGINRLSDALRAMEQRQQFLFFMVAAATSAEDQKRTLILLKALFEAYSKSPETDPGMRLFGSLVERGAKAHAEQLAVAK